MNDPEAWCYVGKRKACGCIVAAVVDDEDDVTRIAESVSEFLHDGLTVERMAVEDVRKAFGCDHEKQEALPLGDPT